MAKSERVPDAPNSQMGRLCLDFANTVDWHASDHPEERLRNYSDLVSWAREVGVLKPREAQHLLREAKRRPSDAAAVLERATVLREAVYRVFSAVTSGRSPEGADLGIVNEALSKALGRLQVVKAAQKFTWGWAGDESALDQMLWPVARSAGDLLTSDQLTRVGQCADDRGCGFLFLDMSRNRSRRWCDMRDCGNRAKVKRHYRRKRTSNSAAGKKMT